MKRISILCCLWVLLLPETEAQAPTANFTADVQSGCSPLVVQFSDLSMGNPTSWTWNFGNGSTSSLQNPATTYFDPGTYTVTLTVRNTDGTNTLTRTQYITVYDKPTVNFDASNTSGCYPVRVQFTDQSTPGTGNTNTQWFWDFGNGTQSTLQNPFVIYNTAGNFTVTLKVTNDKGCYSVRSIPNLIQVTQGVSAEFTHTQPTVCRAPADISFTNQSTGPGTLTYQWQFGDGNSSTQQNPVHTYTSPGTYDVTLISTSSSGCIDTLIQTETVTIGGITTAITAPDSICINDPLNLINASSPDPAGSVWDFGDGNTSTELNPVHIYSQPGNYLVELVNDYGYCIDSASVNVTVSNRPVSAFTAPITTRCQPPLTVDFQDQSTGAVSWFWDFGDGNSSTDQNPSHTYNSYGDFDVTLITTNAAGCTDTLRNTAFVNIRRPIIQLFNLPRRGCVPYTISPSAGINTLDNVTSWFWDFGDGTTSTLPSPSHVYPNQGTYNIKLVITTSTGCTDSTIMFGAVQVGTEPVVDFTASPLDVCAYQPVSFTNLSVPSDEWLWTFGDGSSSTLENPVYEYSDTGSFDVQLIAWNNGCPDSMMITNYIHVKPPIADFSAVTACIDKMSFIFTDESIGATTWFWDFGDGTTSTDQNPVHGFPSLGTYPVTLTVTNDTCSHSITQDIRVIDEAASFSSSNPEVCKGTATSFSVANINTDNIISYQWEFGNGVQITSSQPDINYTYPATGVYTVTLIVTDANNCRDTIVRSNYIRINGPRAIFITNDRSGCVGLTPDFQDLSITDGRNPIVSWHWDFGDGHQQTFTAPPFQHVYDVAGIYDVVLTVTDAFGCVDSSRRENYIITTDPLIRFTSADTLTCPGSEVDFVNTSVGAALQYVWDFGDGNSSTAVRPTHIYNATGLYTVMLSVVDIYGCHDTLRKEEFITVDEPIASFTVNDSISSCTPFEVVFTNTSHYFVSSFWDLGGGTNMLENPVFFYSLPGTYDVELVVTSPGGCTDTARKQITVYDTTGARIDYLPINGCKPLEVDFDATATGIYTYLWDYGDGSIDTTTIPAITHTYNTFGDFVPKVILRDPAGCLIPVTGIDTIHIRGATAKFGIDRTLLCDSGRVQIIDSTEFNEAITSYLWDFGDGNTSSLQEPSHTYTSPGIYNITLQVETVSGCTDQITKPNLVKVVASPLIAIGGDSTACVFEQMRHTGLFLRTDTSAVEWSWQFPNGNGYDAQNPPIQTYTQAGSFDVSVIVTNSSGCADTVIKAIEVYPLPEIDMPPTLTMQAGFPVQIPATYSPNVNLWRWTPVEGLNCSTCPTPVATPSFNTEYSVLFTDINGCRNTGTISIIVYCNNSNVFIPNTFSPNGDGSNDVFYPRGRGLNRIRMLRIFNRWGEVVFEKQDFPVNDPGVGWDGRVKGQAPHSDVYVYQVEVYCSNGEIITFNGNVALIL